MAIRKLQQEYQIDYSYRSNIDKSRLERDGRIQGMYSFNL